VDRSILLADALRLLEAWNDVVAASILTLKWLTDDFEAISSVLVDSELSFSCRFSSRRLPSPNADNESGMRGSLSGSASLAGLLPSLA
jgi:hypothetical protein